MGMCVIKGPRILHEDGDGELSPRSVTSSASSSISSSTSEDCGSPTHQELETPVASPVQCYSDGAIWQRMISKVAKSAVMLLMHRGTMFCPRQGLPGSNGDNLTLKHILQL
ncbi:uncharacterized protein [Physcomitrium patens]|uniref:Uncharacterized protein n=1 Tax=Physcomitrium patens TaxID=3218 RepID=A0A2K1ITV0_PHYPA|nr:uncharacterized protein LOC112273004 [Physcomitrium patens]PNR32707.1 hypothetical protein PHYPA_024649 [Physcomitrium patens]|eukprot:XP_024357059.1 uncharacterized protein LOC112273004 [Physcomitrella patens]